MGFFIEFPYKEIFMTGKFDSSLENYANQSLKLASELLACKIALMDEYLKTGRDYVMFVASDDEFKLIFSDLMAAKEYVDAIADPTRKARLAQTLKSLEERVMSSARTYTIRLCAAELGRTSSNAITKQRYLDKILECTRAKCGEFNEAELAEIARLKSVCIAA
jgi:hypothetical protein